MEIKAKFEGGVTDRHVLPAIEGSQSLEGLSRALTLTSHYLITSTVRKKYPFDTSARIYLGPPKAGSFDAIYSLLSDKDTFLTTTFYGTLGVGVFGAFLKDAVQLVFNRLIGKDHKPTTDELKRMLDAKPGDFEALGEAVEPALVRAHSVINNGAGTINIISGGTNIIHLNEASKTYLSTTLEDNQVRQKAVSCGMLNVNTRNGRVYDEELQRTVAIKISKNATPTTMTALAESLQRYSSRKFGISGSEVIISYTFEADQNGIIKKYIVLDAQIPRA